MRFFIEVMYDGRAFHGSQLQGGLPTVQLSINTALSTLLRREVNTVGASRTDEGVHALCSFYHFDAEETEVNGIKLTYQMNAVLPAALSVKKIYRCIDSGMNARFDALTRRYRYRIYKYKDPFRHGLALYYPFSLDVEKLHETAQLIRTTTDFTSFAKRHGQSKTNICTIKESYWQQADDELQYIVVGNRFLRGMVRGLVGTQLRVARGRHSVLDFQHIIAAKDCTLADFSVSGNGLYLEHIEYPGGSLTEAG